MMLEVNPGELLIRAAVGYAVGSEYDRRRSKYVPAKRTEGIAVGRPGRPNIIAREKGKC